MRAAKMKERPTFQLMCQTDVQSIYHMQMPRWLFSDPRYCEMSLDAKVTYTFLLNRFQLSRKNGWVNDRGEVFVIFPRKALAKELRICEQRVTAAFKKLVELKLVWEKRCGRGDANQIYLARVTPIEDPDYSCAPFITEDESEVRGSRTSDLEGLADGKPSAACQEPQNLLSKNREDRASRTAKSAFPEPQKLTPSKKEKRKIDQSHMEVRPSVRAPAQDGRTDGDAEEKLRFRQIQKKNFWIFWTAASLNASHRKPLWCLKTPLSGFFMPTASVLAMPRFRKAACGQSSDGWTA